MATKNTIHIFFRSLKKIGLTVSPALKYYGDLEHFIRRHKSRYDTTPPNHFD